MSDIQAKIDETIKMISLGRNQVAELRQQASMTEQQVLRLEGRLQTLRELAAPPEPDGIEVEGDIE